MLKKIVLCTPARHWNIAALARLFRIMAWLTYGFRLTALVALLIIGVQLFYPSQMARPFTRLDGRTVSFWSKAKLTRFTAENGQKPYVLTVAGHTYKESPSNVGVTSDSNKTVARVLRYSLWQRLVPLSIVFHKDYMTSKRINNSNLQLGLDKFAQNRAQDPINASIAKIGNIYSVQPDKPGYVVDTKRLQTYIVKAPFATKIKVPRKTIHPAITEQMGQAVLKAWVEQTGKPVTIQGNKQTIVIPPEVLRTWVVISTNQKQDNLFITYDQTAVKKWLNTYAVGEATAPKPAVRYIQDDEVVNTTPGSNGAVLNFDGSAVSIITALQNPVRNAVMQMTSIAFRTQDVRSYSPTSKGMQAIINDWSSKYKGMTAGVNLQEIGGQSRAASLRDNQQFFAASIYKLFLALYAYKQMEANTLNPSLVVANNSTIDSCLEAMIVVSDNDCPHQIANQLGWANIDSFTKQQGFGTTSIVDGNSSTNTADTAKFLAQLYKGNLFNADHSSALLDKMRRQVYRDAIPAGSSGSTVYDKVGFYQKYWHDAAIVQGQKATYVLVVFTNNGPGPSAIKDLAAQIQQTINQ